VPGSGRVSTDAEVLLSAQFVGLGGEPRTLEEFQGQVLLVDFFATWCVPCADSLPVYSRWQEALESRGLRVILVSLDEVPEEIPPFVARHAPKLVVFRDPEGRVAGQLNLPGMPTLFLLDREGRLVERHVGFRPGDEAELRALLERALAPR
jgi:thiol-disulfide isomerase/thioredoxin